MRHWLPFAVCTLSCWLVTSIAHAQPNGFQVCGDLSNQTVPEMIPDGAGGFIVAWLDGRNGAGSNRIYAQRLSATGIPQWIGNGVAVSVANGNDAEPCIVSDGAGGAIIAWQHSTPSGIITVQRVNSSGALQWPTAGPKNGVQVTISGSGVNPVITTDGSGGAIVAWKDVRGALGTYDIYAARLTSTGNLPWTSGGVAVCNAANDQQWPVIVPDAAGGAILAWYDQRTGFDIYMERMNASGAPQWGSGTGILLGATTNVAESPAITTDGAGGAIIAWGTNSPNFDLIAQRIDATGAAQWGGGTSVCAAVNLQLHPQIAADGASGAFVTWQDTRTHPTGDAYVQRVNAAGVTQWTPDGVDLTNGNAEFPVITPNMNGGALVAWVDTRNTGVDQHNIYAHAVTSSGVPGFPTDGTPIAVVTDDQIGVRVASTGANAFIAWQDRRSGGWDIYAQVLSVATAVGDTPSLPAWSLSPNQPNPFNDRTTMNLDLSAQSDLTVDVFDVAGRRVRHDDLGRMNAGVKQLTFDGHDDDGRALASGVYFYRVHSGAKTLTRKMVIAR